MFADITAEELTTALDDCAAGLLWETAVDEPPVDAVVIAQRLGLVVAFDDHLACRARFVQLAEHSPHAPARHQGTIITGPAERPERRQWAVAHEIGESVAHRVFARLGVPPRLTSPEARERVANDLAQCLLLPRRWFAADGPDCDWDLMDLKAIYATASHELIARRMLEMRPPVVITLCDQGHVKWRRASVGSRPPRLLAQELDAWQTAHITGLPAEEQLDPATTGLDRARAWPIHESGWKREIIRSDVAEM